MSDPKLHEVTLHSGSVSVGLLNYGAITRFWQVDGVPVIMGHADVRGYLDDPAFTGVIVGRVANRTAGGRFEYDGQVYQLDCNEGENHLHGGAQGLARQVWTLETDGANHARLTHLSPDGAQGYPGAVAFCVDISLCGTTLTYDMRATPDRPTPVNLAQHNYYNLSGDGAIWGHAFWINAAQYLPTGTTGLPTGKAADVTGTRFDFRQQRQLDRRDIGLDHNYIIAKDHDPTAPVATLHNNGLCLRMWSDQPGIQVFTGAEKGICLEPQFPPNVLNNPDFGSIIASASAPYRQVLRVDIQKVTP